jgi:hypothetical protein
MIYLTMLSKTQIIQHQYNYQRKIIYDKCFYFEFISISLCYADLRKFKLPDNYNKRDFK